MEFVREAANPWGQNVLLGIAWDLMWVALLAGVAFVVIHAIWAQFIAKSSASQPAKAGGATVPEQVERHSLSSRVFHWGMSFAMLALLVTAFVPVMGWQFPWVTIHWIAGVVLIALIVYHVIRATFWQDLWAMWIGKEDVAELKAGMKQIMGSGVAVPKAAKYPVDHKMFHHAAAVAGLGTIVTGLLMLLRIDTMFWQRNQYVLSDGTWGFVYVLHGLSGVALITLVITHIYFAIRPEKWWITKSMIYGWISREKYLEHHDPAKWPVGGSAAPVAAGADAPPQDQPVGHA